MHNSMRCRSVRRPFWQPVQILSQFLQRMPWWKRKLHIMQKCNRNCVLFIQPKRLKPMPTSLSRRLLRQKINQQMSSMRLTMHSLHRPIKHLLYIMQGQQHKHKVLPCLRHNPMQRHMPSRTIFRWHSFQMLTVWHKLSDMRLDIQEMHFMQPYWVREKGLSVGCDLCRRLCAGFLWRDR